jgi:RNA polymerase sigma-70 factor (ECF subfamily)
LNLPVRLGGPLKLRARAFPSGEAAGRPVAQVSPLDEGAEVLLAKQGDASIWDAWFQRHYSNLFRYAYIRLRRRAEAEEVASQVFVEAFRGIDRYSYTGKPLLAWLYRIAHNLVYDRLKAEERRAALLTESPSSSEIIDGPEKLIANIDLLNAIETLTDDQRDIVILRFFLGMSAQEVSALVSKSPAAVFSLQARALIALRARLGEDVHL